MTPLPIDKFPKLGALLTIDFDSIFQEQCAVNAETVFLFKFQITCLAFALVQFWWYQVCTWHIELERLTFKRANKRFMWWFFILTHYYNQITHYECLRGNGSRGQKIWEQDSGETTCQKTGLLRQEIRQKSPGEVDGGEGGRLGGGKEMGTTEGKCEALALEECLKSTREGKVKEGEGQDHLWVSEERE